MRVVALACLVGLGLLVASASAQQCAQHSFSADHAVLDQGASSAGGAVCHSGLFQRRLFSNATPHITSVADDRVYAVDVGASSAHGIWTTMANTPGVSSLDTVDTSSSYVALSLGSDSDFNAMMASAQFATRDKNSGKIRWQMAVVPDECYRLVLFTSAPTTDRDFELLVDGDSKGTIHVDGDTPGGSMAEYFFTAASTTVEVTGVAYPTYAAINGFVLEKQRARVDRLTSLSLSDPLYKLDFGLPSGSTGEFTSPESTSGIALSTTASLETVSSYKSAPAFGSSELNSVLHSLVVPKATLTITADVTAEEWYTVYVMSYARRQYAVANVQVDGTTVVDALNPYALYGAYDSGAVAIAHVQAQSGQIAISVSSTGEPSSSFPVLSGIVIDKYVAPSETLVSLEPYVSTGAEDVSNSIFSSDHFAAFKATSATQQPSVEFTVPSCSAGQYHIEFRYAAAQDFQVEIHVDGVKQATLTAPHTSSSSLFMRSPLRIESLALSAGDHKVKVVKLGSQAEGLNLHRLIICDVANADVDYGCTVHQVLDSVQSKPLGCYDAKKPAYQCSTTIPQTLEGFATGTKLSTLDEFMSVCASRSDCGGVQWSNSGPALCKGSGTTSCFMCSIMPWVFDYSIYAKTPCA